MATSTSAVDQSALQQVSKPLSLIPVGLKEAALDSPTFRATTVHFSDQVEIIENWLNAYAKATSKLVQDVSSLEDTINNFITRSTPPNNVSEAVVDHDYTLLAMRRFGEASKESWGHFTASIKKMDTTIVEPIRSFMAGELRNFKDARRYLEQSQKTFDSTLARYLSQSKTKEPSSLREDAFQVHEIRKTYLKASLDFCLLAPQLRFSIDKLLVRISADQWRESKKSRESISPNFGKWSQEMDRVKGWSKEMEAGESVFRKELQLARKDIAESAAVIFKPSRELEDYNSSTMTHFAGSKGPSTVNVQGRTGDDRAAKQGWLYLRTVQGKPARTSWVRRWFYVKNGMFGWLNTHLGGVEESEKIGVLLCNVKPAFQEDRRFCFEVKTKKSTILVQAETQPQLVDWLEAFEMAKNKALEVGANDVSSHPGGVDPAFAITLPSMPEFAINDGITSRAEEAISSTTLTLPQDGTTVRGSVDLNTATARKLTVNREDGESGREHAARLMQKLDLRKSAVLDAPPPPGQTGIASLISASHNILPAHALPSTTSQASSNNGLKINTSVLKDSTNTLAPSTLTVAPAPTNLSKVATLLGAERGIGIGKSDTTGGMPSSIMANLWGSSNWGYINKLKDDATRTVSTKPAVGLDTSQTVESSVSTNQIQQSVLSQDEDPGSTTVASATTSPLVHRKAASMDTKDSMPRVQPATTTTTTSTVSCFPSNYPTELKIQEAQFRVLFPNVAREDKLVLVFRATWNPNDLQEFPGRVYVTTKDIYFYSHHLGLVLISQVGFDKIEEVTAAPGKDCDFLFIHLKQRASGMSYTRITIKTFLEPLRLLQSRLNYLVENQLAYHPEPIPLDETMTALIKLETQDPTRSPSMESWEEIPGIDTPGRDTFEDKRERRNLKAALHVEKGLTFGRNTKEVAKYTLPAHPVVYEPQGMDRKTVERKFDISPKALFHVLFGDRSAVFQLLYHERRAQRIAQGPWTQLESGHMSRDFHFQIDYQDMFRRHRQANVADKQVIEIKNDHICYVVADMKTPWHLPHHEDFMLITKIVITHIAKSKCKLAIYTKVDWSKAPTFSKGLVERQALDDLDLDVADLVDVITDQVKKLGPQSRTRKAIQIFGHVGQQTSVSLFAAANSIKTTRTQIKQRTLTSMLYETTSSITESCVTSLMMWTFAGLKKAWNIASAHSILLTLLMASAAINLFLSGKETSIWWTERKATKFMHRIGVGPNTMMSKAIYIKDLDSAMSSLAPELGAQADTKCYEAFRSIVNTTNMDAPYYESSGGASTKSTAKRLQRTRQNLGSYRHDLVVAMRVVNNVEQAMIRAEWETFLLDEMTRCKQVEKMLRTASSSLTENVLKDGVEHEKPNRMAILKDWHDEYCGSCMVEQEHLLDGKSHLVFQ